MAGPASERAEQEACELAPECCLEPSARTLVVALGQASERLTMLEDSDEPLGSARGRGGGVHARGIGFRARRTRSLARVNGDGAP
jgi:hypothetical protein